MPRVTILQASDLHIARVPNQTPSRGFLGTFAPYFGHDLVRLEAFAAFAWRRRNDYQALLLSGDLATTGRDTDLLTAASLLTSPANRHYLDANGNSTLVRLTPLLSVLPGNHDRYRDGWFILHSRPGGRRFDAHFNPWWSVGQGSPTDRDSNRSHTGVQVLNPISPAGKFRVVLIGADCTLRRGDWGTLRFQYYNAGSYFRVPYPTGGYLGQGRAYDDLLNSSTEETTRLRGKRNKLRDVILWVVHFDPTNPCPALELLQADRLLAQAQELSIPAILTGHTHVPSDCRTLVPGFPTRIIRCGSTTQCSEPNGNFLNFIDIDIDDDGQAVVSLRPFKYASFSNAGTFINLEETRTEIIASLRSLTGQDVPQTVEDTVNSEMNADTLYQWSLNPRQLLPALLPPPSGTRRRQKPRP